MNVQCLYPVLFFMGLVQHKNEWNKCKYKMMTYVHKVADYVKKSAIPCEGLRPSSWRLLLFDSSSELRK